MSADWGRAPRALLRAPPLFAGCAAAALLVTFAASSALLFTSAAGSAAFKDRIAQISPLGAGLQVTRTGQAREPDAAATVRAHERRGRAVGRAVGSSAALGARRDTLLTGLVALGSGSRTMDALLVARAGAREHVRRLAGGGDGVWIADSVARAGAREHVRRLAGGGDGVWIADSVAAQLRVRPGDTISITALELGGRRVDVRVGGVYRALWKDVANDDWVNFSRLIYPQGVDPDAPPTFALASADEVARAYRGLGGSVFTETWEWPVDLDGLTLDRGRALARRFSRVAAELGGRSRLAAELGCREGDAFRQTSCAATSSLTAAIGLADASADAVSAPSRLLGGVGLAIALGVAAAVGVFLVTRRRGEARHRFARGEGPGTFAARTALEAAPALVLGGAAGFALTLLLVRGFEPSASLGAHELEQGVAGAAVALAAAGLLLVGAATATFLRQYGAEPRALGRLALVPWELGALGVGVYLLVSIRSGGGLSGGRPSLPVFLAPLLLLAGVTGLVLRGARRLLARTRGGGLATYLAARRAAAGPSLVVALTILCAASLGVLFYARALAASLDHATRQKAEIAIGGDVQGNVDPDARVPRLPFPATVVQVVYGGVAVGGPEGDQVDLMAVDPTTLGAAMHWDDAWGARPDLSRLARLRNGRVPVVVAAGPRDLAAIWISGERIPVEVVGRTRAFPGMSAEAPLVVASRDALVTAAGPGSYDTLGSGLAYVWARGPTREVERALSASPVQPAFSVSVDDVLRNRDVAAARRTYSFLTALGVSVAVLALVGVALYLYARQRSQAIASALARRMGLGRRVEVLSLWLELAAVLVVAAALAAGVGLAAAAPVIARTDPLPSYAPAPSFVGPWLLVAVTFATLLLVALVAALATSAAARRVDVAQELRLG